MCIISISVLDYDPLFLILHIVVVFYIVLALSWMILNTDDECYVCESCHVTNLKSILLVT